MVIYSRTDVFHLKIRIVIRSLVKDGNTVYQYLWYTRAKNGTDERFHHPYYESAKKANSRKAGIYQSRFFEEFLDCSLEVFTFALEVLKQNNYDGFNIK